MNEELEIKLYNIDPIFFEEAIACENGTMNETNTCMAFGCECHDGWFEPLQKFVKKVKIINNELKKYNTKIVCEQLKEKWGALTVYYCIKNIDLSLNDKVELPPPELLDMMKDAYHKAIDDCWNTCEICGADGGYDGRNLVTTSTGWVSRICKKCAKERTENKTKNFDKSNNKEHIPRITWFHDEYEFLNLFHIRGFKYNNEYYNSIIEAFFANINTKNKDLYQCVGSKFKDNKSSPYLIKNIANHFNLKYEDTNENRLLLKNIIKAKFNYEWNKDLKSELLETKGMHFQNMGRHCDNILGHCVCERCKDKEQKDLYAKILMEVREEFLNE